MEIYSMLLHASPASSTTPSPSPPGSPPLPPPGPSVSTPAAATSTPSRHISSPLPPPPLSHSHFLAHYSPKTHSIECLTYVPTEIFTSSDSLFVSFSSIFWHEVCKYREHVFWYCNHDVGHIIDAVSMVMAAMGWDVRLVDGLGHDEFVTLLGLDRMYPAMPSSLPDCSIRGALPWVEMQDLDCLLLVFPFGMDPVRGLLISSPAIRTSPLMGASV